MPSEIEFFFDVGSPYSYLASTQIDAVGERHATSVRWRPFLLGGVFKSTGNQMPAGVEAKGRYMLRDLHRWARDYGVPFRFSSHFPIRTLSTQRALVTAMRHKGDGAMQRLAQHLFRACWVDDRDVSEEGVIRESASEAGLDPELIIAGIGAQETKDRLRENTDEAVRRGAFGAPTFFVEEEMFWGTDRLGQLEGLLERLKSGR